MSIVFLFGENPDIASAQLLDYTDSSELAWPATLPTVLIHFLKTQPAA
jgi:hypothetical protein